ncbi:hypothetical protein O181_021824 [Austropuccinia psidii MF-1]|uniref:Uncharacterized protein n=1 Tax=Austropuccinia psidii MF-1 TaxID=1389203 RepID=A0A9Q3GX21_9BASI|nr:hypothetical protein [Austropuccinia psidii MF-1]
MVLNLTSFATRRATKAEAGQWQIERQQCALLTTRKIKNLYSMLDMGYGPLGTAMLRYSGLSDPPKVKNNYSLPQIGCDGINLARWKVLEMIDIKSFHSTPLSCPQDPAL